MKPSARLALVLGLLCAWIAACDRGPDPNDPSQMQPVGYDQYGNPIYNQPGQPPPYGTQPQPYGTQPQPYGTQPQPYGTQPPPYPQQQPPPQPTSQPSPLALPCQSDITCGTHRCNLQVGKCAFPCANAQTDCAAGMACMSGVCMPGAR